MGGTSEAPDSFPRGLGTPPPTLPRGTPAPRTTRSRGGSGPTGDGEHPGPTPVGSVPGPDPDRPFRRTRVRHGAAAPLFCEKEKGVHGGGGREAVIRRAVAVGVSTIPLGPEVRRRPPHPFLPRRCGPRPPCGPSSPVPRLLPVGLQSPVPSFRSPVPCPDRQIVVPSPPQGRVCTPTK